jgi:hypothetical protein
MADDDEGAAVVEFIFLSLVLMVPIVYLVLTLAEVQAAAFAAEAVARDASRAAVVAGVNALQDGASWGAAERAARDGAATSTALTLSDFDVDADSADVSLACSGSPCLAPGSDIDVRVSIEVRLPGIGALVPRAVVTVEAAGSSPVDGYVP